MTSDTLPEVRDTLEPVAGDALVVGHDGSAGADTALMTALELADQLKAPVIVARAWSIATAPRPADWTFGYVSSTDDLERAVLEELTTGTETFLKGFPDVAVSYRALQGSPTQALIHLSRAARMLVVGSRGMGGFAEMVLGSVSDQCVRYARCPVLVVRIPRAA